MHLIIKILILNFSFIIIFCLNIIAQNKYVSPTGNNSFSGNNSSQPYADIQFAINNCSNIVNRVDTLFIMQGTFFPTIGIDIRKPIVLKNFSTSLPIIDASNKVFNTGNPYILGIISTSNVTIEGIIIQNGIYSLAKGIWILNDEPGPVRTNIVIKNSIIRNIGWISNNLFTLPSDVDRSIGTNAIRLQSKNSNVLKNVNILNNEIYNCATGWGEAISVTGNVDSFYIKKNKVHHIANIGIVAIGNYSYTGVSNPSLNQSRNGEISENTVYNCMSGRGVSAGIYLDGARNCLIERNEIYNSGAGISLGAEQNIPSSITVGNHKIRNNLIRQNSIAGIFIGSDTNSKYVKNSSITDNTFFKNATGDTINGIVSIGEFNSTLLPVYQVMEGTKGEILLQNNENIIFQNNIIYPLNGRRFFVGLNGKGSAIDSSKNFKSNFNLFFVDTTYQSFYFANQHNFNGNLLNTSFLNIPTFTTATQQDSNSYFGNPKFKNATASDFRLDSCSAAIDRGNPIYDANINGTIDYYNNLRRYSNSNIDIGTAEFQASNKPCVFNLLTATPQCNGTTPEIKINWTKSNNANSYKVFLNPNLTTPLNSGLLTDTFFVHSPLISGSSNTYTVLAFNSDGTTNTSNNLTAIAGVCPTGGFTLNPLTLQCNGVQPQIRLNWSASTNATSYKIYRGTGGPVSFYANAGNVLTFTDNVNYGITYSYQVRATNTIDSSFNTNGILNQTNKICKPGAFTLDSVIAKCGNSNLSYIKIITSPSLNVTSYSIFRRTGNILPDTFYKNIIVPTSTGLIFNDSFVTPGTIYSYRIKAKNDADSIFHNNSYLFDTALHCTPTSVFYLDNNKLDIKINPNPVKNQVRLSINAGIAFPLKRIQLINSDGKMIASFSVNTRANNFTKIISCTNLSAGTYYLQIIFDNKKNVVIPFVKL